MPLDTAAAEHTAHQSEGAAWRDRVYLGRVAHTRLTPFKHALDYRIFSMLVDIDAIPELARTSKLFRHNRFGLFSFHDADHGARDVSPLRPWVEAALRKAGIVLATPTIHALCIPRILGYVFNPLTIYYCRDAQGALRAIVYEVKNTFGEQHGYVLEAPAERANDRPGALIRQGVAKRFHVSPFMDVAGGYRFTVATPGEKLAVSIRYQDDDGRDLLIATHTGRGAPFGDKALLRALARHPGMAAKVMLGIHWEALKLWIKGAKFHRKPAPPNAEVSFQEAGR